MNLFTDCACMREQMACVFDTFSFKLLLRGKVSKMDKKNRHPKTTEKQFDLMLDFMSSNKSLITGKLSPGKGPEYIQSLWKELCVILNSVGDGPAKTVDGWKKTWNEYKCNTRKRARSLRIEQTKTGGGEPKTKHLSHRDERLLGLLSRITSSVEETTAAVTIHDVSEDILKGAEITVEQSPTMEVEVEDGKISSQTTQRIKRVRGATEAAPKRRRTSRTVAPSAAERATTAYAAAMEGRNKELAKNTAAIKDLAAAMREMAAAMHAVANSMQDLNKK